MADAARSKGNDAFAARDFAAALAHYTAALEVDPKDHVAWNNLALSHYQLGHYEEAISAGQRCLVLNPTNHKMYLSIARAAKEIGDYLREEEFLTEAVRVAPGNPLYKQLLTQSTVAHMKAYYAKHVANTPLEPAWLGEQRGKGFTARKDLPPGITLLRESPLVSVRNVACTTNAQSCSHCLRTMLSEEELIPYPEIVGMLSLPVPRWVACAACGDAYCSERCRDTASKQYHALLCPAKDRNHPTVRLETLAKSLKRTNPLLIARIFARALQTLVSGAAKTWSHAFEPFSVFVANPEPSASDDVVVKLIVEALQLAAPTVPLHTYVTLQAYRMLNGAIIRNASSIHTVSDVHTAVIAAHEKGAPLKALYKLIDCKEDARVEEVLGSDFMLGLCVEGTGLYAVANTFNHSCVPNLALVSSFNCHDMQLLTLSPVRPGQELLISYIDETKPAAVRQAKLREMYYFTCDCRRCATGT